MRLVFWLLKLLLEGIFPRDLLDWVDKDKKIFRVCKKHGNGTRCIRTRIQDSALFLAWEKLKGRHVNLDVMEAKKVSSYLTKIKGNFNNALLNYDQQYLKRIKRTKDYWDYQFLPKGLAAYENYVTQQGGASPNADVLNASQTTNNTYILVAFSTDLAPGNCYLIEGELLIQSEVPDSSDAMLTEVTELLLARNPTVNLEEPEVEPDLLRDSLLEDIWSLNECQSQGSSPENESDPKLDLLEDNKSIPVLDLSPQDFLPSSELFEQNQSLPLLTLSDKDFSSHLEAENLFEDSSEVIAMLTHLDRQQ